MNYAKFIKKLRVSLDLSQKYVAHQLGMSRPTYIQIENGERELTISECKKLAFIFNLSVEDFLNKQKPKENVAVTLDIQKDHSHNKPDIRINVPQQRIDKFKDVLLYILDRVGAKPNVGETVIYKLLYFIDFDFYEKYEEQLIGATYIKNHHGPTPVEFKKITDQMEDKDEIVRITNKYFKYDQKKYLPLKKPNLKNLTALELEHIEDVLTRLADKNATDLTNYSHEDVPWITAENGRPIDYEAVFYRTERTSVRNYED